MQWHLVVVFDRRRIFYVTSKKRKMQICLFCQLMLFFLKIHLSRYMLRNMQLIRKHFSSIMLKPMPKSIMVEPSLTLQSFWSFFIDGVVREKMLIHRGRR